MVKTTETKLKEAVKELAFKQKLSAVQIKRVCASVGIDNIHINPLLCSQCRNPVGEVDEYNACKSCRSSMTLAEKKFQKTQPAIYGE